jgi:hypothetical protein
VIICETVVYLLDIVPNKKTGGYLVHLLCIYSSACTVGFISGSQGAVAYLMTLSVSVAVRCRIKSRLRKKILKFIQFLGATNPLTSGLI